MLVLSRHAGEAILIGDEMTVRVLRIDGDSVQIAVKAPQHVQILRGELESPLRPLREALALLPRLSLQFAGAIH